MRRLAPLLLFLLPALAQKPVLGLALEGQALPIGLVGFARLEQGGTSSEARAGWELLGGAFADLADRSWNTDLPSGAGWPSPWTPPFGKGCPRRARASSPSSS